MVNFEVTRISMHSFLILVLSRSRGQTKMSDRMEMPSSMANLNKRKKFPNRSCSMDRRRSLRRTPRRLSRGEEGGRSRIESNSCLKLHRPFHKPNAQIILPPRYELQFLALLRKELPAQVIVSKICVKPTYA